MKGQPYSCGFGPAFDVIGGKWKALILWEVHSEPVRFGELKRRVPGISEKMLIQQLREMEADEIVHREVYHQVPPRVEYSVTEFGASLIEALIPLAEWGEQHMLRIAATHRPGWAQHASEAAACAPHGSSDGDAACQAASVPPPGPPGVAAATKHPSA